MEDLNLLISGPPIHIIDQIEMPKISVYHLDNGIPVYEIDSGTQDVVKIEFIHLGGRLNEEKRLTSRATVHMVKESSRAFTQKELAEYIDFYGASLVSDFSMDHTSITLHTLGKYLDLTMAALADVVFFPKFSDDELMQYKERNINNLAIDLQKNDILAYREFTDRIFGREHVYGFNSTPEMYKDLTLEDIENHYQNYMGTANAVIVVSGKISDERRKLINESLGQIRRNSKIGIYQNCNIPCDRKTFSIKGKGDFQNSIILGRRLFTRSHSEYPAMVVLNTVLGGYFGSRLMKRLREDLGYTYEISSQLDMMRNDGFFYISTDVDPENTVDCIRVIYEEIDRIAREPISDEERKMVINYIMGNMVNMLDGPFKVARWVNSLITSGQSLMEGHQILNALSRVDQYQIQVLAEKYLRKENLMELVVY